MTGSPGPTHTAVSSPPPHAAWGYLKLQEMFHPHLALMFMPPLDPEASCDGYWAETCKTRQLGAEHLWGTWHLGREEAKRSAAFQQPDLERVICFSEPCFLVCKMGIVILRGWQKKADGVVVLTLTAAVLIII